MTEPRVPRLEIPEEVARAEGVPEDLDSEVFELYEVPDTARRRKAAFVYVVAAVVTALGIVLGLPAGMWLIVVGFFVIALYHAMAAWRLAIREGAALDIANRATGFPVGHASAALNFDGWLAKPVWNVLVFSADDPPSERGLVRVDALSGDIVEQYVEAVPPE